MSTDEAGCETPEECDWREVMNWEGDPDVINGTHSWAEYLCRTCGAVVQDRPATYLEEVRDDFDLD